MALPLLNVFGYIKRQVTLTVVEGRLAFILNNVLVQQRLHEPAEIQHHHFLHALLQRLGVRQNVRQLQRLLIAVVYKFSGTEPAEQLRGDKGRAVVPWSVPMGSR